MRTRRTAQFLNQHQIVPLVADYTRRDPQIGALLIRLGNAGRALPFYAIIPPNDRPAITFSDALLTQADLLGYLEQAVESSPTQTAMAVER